MKVSFVGGKFQAFEENHFGSVSFSAEVEAGLNELDALGDAAGSNVLGINRPGYRGTLLGFGGADLGPETVSANPNERVRKAEVRQKETIALYMPHKLNVAHFNTYDTPEFSVVKDVSALTEGDVSGVAASLFRKAAGIVDGIGQIAGTDVNAARAIAAATGKVLNPRRETLFVAPEL